MLVAVVVGAAWAAIAAVLKVWRGVSEVISTLMLNFIATSGLIAYLLTNYLRATNEAGDLVTKTKPLPPESFIPPLNRFLEVFGLHLPAELNGFLVGAILLGVGFYVLVWRTRFGFDLRATGANAAAARAAGVNPKAMILKTMADQRRHRRPRRHRSDARRSAVPPLQRTAGGHALRFHRHRGRPPRSQPSGRHRVRGAALRHHRSGHASALAAGGSPKRSRRSCRERSFCRAVIAYEVVRRIRVAAEVRDAAAKAEPRAMGGAIPERVPA